MAIIVSTAVGNVVLKEGYEGYKAGMDVQRGPYVVKRYLCEDWSKVFPAINGLVSQLHTCPESPNLYCLNAEVVPQAEIDARDGGRPRFNHGVIEATYGLRPWEQSAAEDPTGSMSFPQDGQTAQTTPYLFMEQSIDWDTEVVKLPNTTYKFKNSPQLPLNVPVGRSIAVCQFVIVRRWQAILPFANICNYLNKVNSGVFLGQPKGQIKFRKARTRRQFSTDSKNTQEVEYVFQWREFDHNKFHRPDSSSWDFIVDDSDNNPYAYSNLGALLA